MVYAARHRVRNFIPYTPGIRWCQSIVFVTVPYLIMTTGIHCNFSVNFCNKTATMSFSMYRNSSAYTCVHLV